MSQPQKYALNAMDTKPTGRNLFIVIFLFTIFAQGSELVEENGVVVFHRKQNFCWLKSIFY